jgi:hypothetical protein
VSLRKQVEELRAVVLKEIQHSTPNPSLERYFRAVENWRREQAGLEPLPYTEEDRKEDEEFLTETLPHYRHNFGWQTEEAQQLLDRWERDIRERLEATDTEGESK